MSVVLGFDYGTHKIGVAVGQALTRTATPLETLGMINRRPDWGKIARLLAEWRPQVLVVGHPFEMTDREADNAAGAKRFARQLQGRPAAGRAARRAGRGRPAGPGSSRRCSRC